jgi:hypothetical protein
MKLEQVDTSYALPQYCRGAQTRFEGLVHPNW